MLISQADGLARQVDVLEARILDWHKANDASRRLATIPGIGPITASAIAVNVPDASLFRSARQFAAWLGLTPRAHSSGGKDRLLADEDFVNLLRAEGLTSMPALLEPGKSG